MGVDRNLQETTLSGQILMRLAPEKLINAEQK